MSRPKEIYFHIGLPKTASTYLQRKVFPNFGNIQFVKKHKFRQHDKIIKKSDSDVILLSSEWDVGKDFVNKKVIRFAEKYPDAKTVIVLRRHDKWLKSKYKYHIRKNGRLTFNEFFNLDDTGRMSVDELRFMSKIEFLQSQFKHRPLVIFQEELAAAPEKVFELLATELNATITKKIPTKKIKSAYSNKQLKSLLRFNQRFPYKRLSKENPEFIRFLHKKYRQLILHSIAYFAKFFPEPSDEKEQELIPGDKLQKIRDYFSEDWNKAQEYAAQTRKLYL